MDRVTAQSGARVVRVAGHYYKMHSTSTLYNSFKGVGMLRDRKALLEQEVKRAHNDAAHMYLILAVGGGDTHSQEYQDLKEKITNLQFDLNVVNQLITQGHQ